MRITKVGMLVLGAWVALAGGCAGHNSGTQAGSENAFTTSAWQNAEPAPASGKGFAPSSNDTLFPSVTITSRSASAASVEESVGDSEKEPMRKVARTADFSLQVASVDTARVELERIAAEAGGFVQQASNNMVHFRVPPDALDATIARIETLGRVLERNVAAEDVTDQYVDVELRIDVATRSRERLVALLENAKVTKDLLEIEIEIRRLTEEIERFKGQRRVLDDRVGFSTVRVKLVESQPVAEFVLPPSVADRFSWMAEMGIARLYSPVGSQAWLRGEYSLLRVLGFPRFEFAPPESFVKLRHDRALLVASNAGDTRVRAHRLHARQEATIAFWGEALGKQLENPNGYLVEESGDFELETPNHEGWRIRTKGTWAGLQWNYVVWLVRDEDDQHHILAIDAAWPASEEGSVALEEIEKQVRAAVVR